MTDRRKTTDRPSASEVLDRPAYSIGEAARYLHMSPATLASWALGRVYPVADGERQWPPLFPIADSRSRRLSFRNLLEANALTAFRKMHGVKIPKIRDAINYVKHSMNIARPLCDSEFRTNGADLFVERYGQLVNVSRGGQAALREVIEAALRRVVFDPGSGVPIRLYALGPHETEQSEFVAFDPHIAFGRPALVAAGVPIMNIADRFRAGESIGSLAEDFGVDRDEIEEAIRQDGLLRATA